MSLIVTYFVRVEVYTVSYCPLSSSVSTLEIRQRVPVVRSIGRFCLMFFFFYVIYDKRESFTVTSRFFKGTVHGTLELVIPVCTFLVVRNIRRVSFRVGKNEWTTVNLVLLLVSFIFYFTEGLVPVENPFWEALSLTLKELFWVYSPSKNKFSLPLYEN